LSKLVTTPEAESWIATCQNQWERQSDFEFGILDAVQGTLLGGVGLNQINRQHHFGNLGYWVRSSASGAGIASRAARLVARFGLTTVGVRRIEVVAATGNLASQRVADKVGATFEGVLRNRLLVRGQHLPARLYSLVPEDLHGSLA
jgi:ribosomal-protein-serine acetyltransferase